MAISVGASGELTTIEPVFSAFVSRSACAALAHREYIGEMGIELGVSGNKLDAEAPAENGTDAFQNCAVVLDRPGGAPTPGKCPSRSLPASCTANSDVHDRIPPLRLPRRRDRVDIEREAERCRKPADARQPASQDSRPAGRNWSRLR
jgi:hypothetical protein